MRPKVMTVVVVIHAEPHSAVACFCERRVASSLVDTFADWTKESVTASNSFFLPLSDPCRDTTIGLCNDCHLRGIDEQEFVVFDAHLASAVRLLLAVDA